MGLGAVTRRVCLTHGAEPNTARWSRLTTGWARDGRSPSLCLHWATWKAVYIVTMLRRDLPTGAPTALSPEEVKLYAMNVSLDIHPWASVEDVCKIVEDKAKLPGLLLNKGRLRQAVCNELETQQPGLEKEYKRRRIQQQRLIEQTVRESAAAKRQKTAIAQRAAAAQPHYSVRDTAMRKQTRDECEQQLRDTKKQLRTLQERGAPEKPVGPEPKRLSRRGPWKDKMRAYKEYCRRVDVLKQRCVTLQRDLNNIGMSRAMFHQQVDNYLPPPRGAHAIVARKIPMTGGHKPYSYDSTNGEAVTYADVVYESGRDQAAKEPERLRRKKIREECEPDGQFPALAPYCGLPDVHPLAHYGVQLCVGVTILTHTRQMVEDLVSAHQSEEGRSHLQSVQAERNEMIRKTEMDGEDYLEWGRSQRLRLEYQKNFQESQQRIHTEKQTQWRRKRQGELEDAAEKLESQPLVKGCKAWRIQQALILNGPQLIVAASSQVTRIAAALHDRYSVLIWVPDDDPRPGRSHDMSISWNLERDVLDFVCPQRNGKPRSAKTQNGRHRATLKCKMAEEIQSWPVAVIIAASTPVSKVHYRAAMALQKDCGITVIVCDPAAVKIVEAGGLEVYAKSRGAKRRKK